MVRSSGEKRKRILLSASDAFSLDLMRPAAKRHLVEGGIVPLAVLAIFKCEVKPDRTDNFMTKLATAAAPGFDSPVMPQSMRLFRGRGHRAICSK